MPILTASDTPPKPDLLGAVLAIDSGSPLVSVALAVEQEVIAEEAMSLERSSGQLLSLVDRVLARSALRPRSLTALVGLRGPGSFTGLRVGLATLQGMRQALRIPVATLSSLQVLASLAPSADLAVTACVDALRGEWLAQPFLAGSPPRPATEPRMCSADELLELESSHLIGFGIARLRGEPSTRGEVVLVEPGPLAGHLLRLLPFLPSDWSSEGLTFPDYLRSPAVSRPARSRR